MVATMLRFILMAMALVSCASCRERNTGGTTTVTQPTPPPPAWKGKRLHLWSTSCDAGSGEVRALLDAMGKHRNLVTSLGMACHTVQADGTLITMGQGSKGRDRAAIVSSLRSLGVAEVSLVVANTAGSGFDGKLGAALLSDDGSRKRLVDQVRTLTQSEGFTVVELDFEALPTSAAGDYARVASGVAAIPDVRVVIDVHPKTVDDPGWEGPAGHDYALLAKTGAVLRLMTYDLSVGPVPPGPSTKSSWVKQVVGYAKSKGVAASQLEIGLPAYGYDFLAAGKGFPIPLKHADVLTLQTQHKASIVRDENGTPHFSYEGPDGTHQVWFDDAQSLSRVLDELRSNVDEVRGVAVWGIAGADPALMGALAKQGFSRPAAPSGEN